MMRGSDDVREEVKEEVGYKNSHAEDPKIILKRNLFLIICCFSVIFYTCIMSDVARDIHYMDIPFLSADTLLNLVK